MYKMLGDYLEEKYDSHFKIFDVLTYPLFVS